MNQLNRRSKRKRKAARRASPTKRKEPSLEELLSNLGLADKTIEVLSSKAKAQRSDAGQVFAKLLSRRGNRSPSISRSAVGRHWVQRKGGRPRGKRAKDTEQRILFAAALRRLGEKTYGMAPKLYPLGKRSRESAEAATRLFLKRNAIAIREAVQLLDEPKAQAIAALGIQASQTSTRTPNKNLN